MNSKDIVRILLDSEFGGTESDGTKCKAGHINRTQYHDVADKITALSPTPPEGKEDADSISIDELFSAFKRYGIDTTNFDGDEGAENAIALGVKNLLSEQSFYLPPQAVKDDWVSVEDGLPEVKQRSENMRHSEWVLVSTDRNSYMTELAIYDGYGWFTSNNPHRENRIKFWKYVTPPLTV